MARELQKEGIVPILGADFNETNKNEGLRETTDKVRKCLSELIYSLQVENVLLEGILISLNLVGLKTVMTEEGAWKEEDATEKVLFLNNITKVN